jgi:glutathione synthase/RimK-type ligase-like ATP-grasp enzyme
MKSTSVLGIYREQIFSPGKVSDDAAILDATLAELSGLVSNVSSIKAEGLAASMTRPSYVLSMARSERALGIIEDWAKRGSRIINSVESVRNCHRKPLTAILLRTGFSLPSSRIVPIQEAEELCNLDGSGAIWLKRGDVHAIQAEDVRMARSRQEIACAVQHFRAQEVRHILVQQHVEGPVVKFYGVGRGRYFRAFLASSGEDIGPHVQQLADAAQRAASAVGLEVYGGDAILAGHDQALLIDFNDWPSFSRCKQSAAMSIADYFTRTCTDETG